MAKYHVNGILSKNGRPYHLGDTISLTEEEAERLGSKVTPLDVVDPDKPLEEHHLKDLKALAKKAGIESYSKKDKATLVAELSAVSNAPAPSAPTPDEVEVVADEPDGN